MKEKLIESIMEVKGCDRETACDAVRIASINWMITEELFSGSKREEEKEGGE